MFLADKHNFGQKVEKVQRGSDTWYRKPRTVYWEWLFFGKTSPLKNLFCDKGEHGSRQLADYLFNLDVEIETSWSGFSKDVAVEDRPATLEHFYAFGVLVAYCYIFGIRDLHKQNLIITRTHLQAVDVEVVFTAITLPHETLLLPFKNIGYEFAGIGALTNSKEDLTQVQIEQIIFGYWDLFRMASEKKLGIDKALATLNFSQMPMRVIVRNTSEYKDLLERKPDNILKSETEQMRRGDIPYFFKFVSDPNLYWLKEKDHIQAEELLGVFQKDIDRHGKWESPGWNQRLDAHLLVQGLLYCVKYLGQEINVHLAKDIFVKGRTLVFDGKIFMA